VTLALAIACLVAVSGCSGSGSDGSATTDATGSDPGFAKAVKLEDCSEDVGGHDRRVSGISCAEANDLIPYLHAPDANELALVPEGKRPERSHESVYTAEDWTCWARSILPFGVRQVCFSGDRVIVFTIS